MTDTPKADPVEVDDVASEIVEPKWGPRTATAAVVVVLAIGIALGVAFRGGPAAPEVELLRSDSGQAGPGGPFAAGPGGFVRPAGDTFEFSRDGRTWTPFNLARGLADDRPIRSMAFYSPSATADVWMIEAVGSSRRGVWVSSDGQDWTRVKWEAPLAETMDLIYATGPGFFGVTRPQDEPASFWWSTDGVEWVPTQFPAEADREQPWIPVPSRAGIVWLGERANGTIEVAVSADAEDWSYGVIDLNAATDQAGELVPGSFEHVAGRWVFTATLPEDGEWTGHVWTSDDIADWEYRGEPNFSTEADRPRAAGLVHAAGDLLLATPFTGGTSDGIVWTGELWATRDGESWTQVGAGLPDLQFAATKQNADGTYTFLYAP